MHRARTQVRSQTNLAQPVKEFRTAVSLHSHTRHSKENLEFLPHYVDFLRAHFVSRVFQSGLKRYYDFKGHALDFHLAYWTPPLTPAMVFASEAEQIERQLNSRALISITDHDTIEGPLELRAQPGSAAVPVSVEWTVPFDGNMFHIGVHHLAPNRSVEIMKEFSRYTGKPDAERLRDLLAYLHGFPETLLVLNHPLQDILRAGVAAHLKSLRHFLARCGTWIHALEWNGMRSAVENREVLRLAEEYDFAVVAGGDRHGCRPNTVLNLSQAENWSDFVASIRSDRRNDILLLPAYAEPAPLRELEAAGDVLRRYPSHPYGQRRFTDRIYFNLEGYGWHPLSFYWDGGNGKPFWLDSVVRVLIALGSDPIRHVFGLFLSESAQFDRAALLQEKEVQEDSPVAEEVSVEPE